MKMEIEVLANIIENGLMKMHISSSNDIGVVSNQNRASADNDLDYMNCWAFLNGKFIDCCIKADAIKGVARVAQPTLKGIEYKDITGDVSILRLDILEEEKGKAKG